MNKIILGVFLVGLVLVFGCTQQVAQEPQTSSAVPAPGSEGVQETIVVEEQIEEEQIEEKSQTEVGQPRDKPQSALKEFTITAKRWDFTPSTITVNEGDTVKLTITSADVSHGFNLPDFGVNERLDPGKTVNVEFVADKKGTFTFACSVPCGSGHSRMSGKLIVN